jgi:PAS domain S-box-containing protein
MKKIAIGLVTLAALATLAFLSLKAKAFSEKEHERFQTALWQLKHLDTAFNEIVLEARFALADNYDDLDADAEKTEGVLEDLKTTPAFIDAAGQKAIENDRLEYKSLLAQRVQLFERFKSQNAMLANSRRYLPVALDELAARLGHDSADRELESLANDLTRAALKCLATPEEASAQTNALQRVNDWCARHPDHREAAFVSSLGRHARIIAKGDGEVDALTRQILALPSEASIQKLFQGYELNVAKAIRRAQQYRLPLYAMSLLLVVATVGAFWALRSANRNLEQRVRERTRELERSEERFRTLCVASPIGIFMSDPQGRFVYANPAWEKISALTHAKTLGDDWLNALHPLDRESVVAEWRSVIKSGSAFAREFRLLLGGQESRWVALQAAAIPGAEGKVSGFVGTIEDITERKSAEAALEQANKQLVEVSHHAGMAEVATSVLHNVGNVLNSINVSAGKLSDQFKKSNAENVGKVASLLRARAADLGEFITNDARGRHLPSFLEQLAEQLAKEKSFILHELGLLAKNVDHVKDIVAMQQSYGKVSGVTEIVRATDLVEDALRMNASALTRHDVHFVREYDEHVPELNVEKHKVLQILVNLIRNAKEACAEAGLEDKRVIVRVANGGDKVRIVMVDNGIGIPMENLTRIFSHGFTTKKQGHGFGLHGAALAARAMGGSLTAQSDGPRHGAVFTLEFPCPARKAAPGAISL